MSVPKDIFVFELGAYIPETASRGTNRSEWMTDRRLFHKAADDGFSPPAALREITKIGESSGNSLSFAGLQAYLWIGTARPPGETSGSRLTRAESWMFPTQGGECCNTDILQWSVRDLTSPDTALWGTRNGLGGLGLFLSSGTPALPTYTAIPEPTSFLLAALGWLLLLRRRR